MSDRKRPREPTETHDHSASCLGLWDLNPAKENGVVVLSSQHTDALCLTGRGRIRCVSPAGAGSPSINGYTLGEAFVNFDSPLWSSWATIRGITPSSRIELQSLFVAHADQDEEEDDDTTEESSNRLSFCIHNPRDVGTRPTALPDSWKVVMDSILSEYLSAIQRQSADSSSSFCVAVTGAKGVGKSTFLRLLMNQCLSLDCCKVALLDLDLGQPELTPSGMISWSLIDCEQPLLQPPSIRTYDPPSHACYFGSATSQTDPTRYIECVQEVLRQLREEQKSQDQPLAIFVNCDGWVKSLGETLLQTVLKHVQPTHIVKIMGFLRSQQFDLGEIEQVSEDNPVHAKILCVGSFQDTETSSGLDQEITSAEATVARTSNHVGESMQETAVAGEEETFIDETTKTNNLQSSDVETNCNNVFNIPLPPLQSPTPLSIAAAIFRTQRLVSYFDYQSSASVWDTVAMSQDGIDDPTCEIARRLSAQRPYKVSLSSLQLEFVHADTHRDIRSLEGMLRVANGSIVGLCCRTHKDNAASDTAHVPTHLLPCLGLGIVRSIDQQRNNGVLYILTPVPLKLLQHVNVLSIGHDVRLPLECYMRGVESECFLYQQQLIQDGNTTNTLIGDDPMHSRNSIARKGLIRNM